MDKKNVLITVGGTGGHLFPAMALAKKLVEENPSYNIFIVGGGLKSNPYFNKQEFPFQETACGSVSLFKPLKSLRSLGLICKGISHSRRLIRDFNPDIVIGFGSYHTLPALIAAKMESIPIILHEANRIPGRVNKILSRYAVTTAVHFPDTGSRLCGKTVPAMIPLRKGYKKGCVSKEQALDYFKLKENRKTLLIFGGSQGAQAINRLASEAVIHLPEELKKEVQVLHFTGDGRSQQQIADLYKKHHVVATVSAFETRMDLAWQAADLMISRSGAGTLAEQLEFEVPGILIPYPYATDNHQESNADYMVDVIQGAIKFLEADLTSEKLGTALFTLLADEGYELQMMKEAMGNHKRMMPSKEFHHLVVETLAELEKGKKS